MQRVDWFGTVIFCGAGILLLLALSLGSSVEAKGFAAPVVIISFVVGGVLLIVFAAWEYLIGKYIQADEDEANGVTPRRFPSFMYKCPKPLKLTEPTIPHIIFKNYDVVVTNFAALTGGMVLFAAFYFLSIYFSIVKGLSATKSGEQLLYFSPGLGVGVIISTRLIKTFRQPKYPIILGTFIIPIAVGLLSNALNGDSNGKISGFLAFAGIGIGLTFAPLTLQARFSQPVNLAATVVSMNMFFRTAGGTIGLAQLSAVLNTKVKSYITAVVSDPNYPLTPSERQAIAGGFSGPLDSVEGILGLDDAARNEVQSAFRRACQWSFISLLPWCCVAAILCVFLHILPEDKVGKAPGSEKVPSPDEEEKEMQAGYANAGSNGHTAQIPPWKTVPTPRGPITLLIWPIRVGFAYLFAYLDSRKQ